MLIVYGVVIESRRFYNYFKVRSIRGFLILIIRCEGIEDLRWMWGFFFGKFIECLFC